MPTTYEPAKKDDMAQLQQAIVRWHGPLDKAKVRVAMLMARNDDGQPVKLHGYTCAATVKINSYKDRVEGKADATIVVDEHAWDDMTIEERLALLDHELEHLELVPDKDQPDVWQTDDMGRPRLKMRLHDWQLGGFAEIVERHGSNAIETRALRESFKFVQQLLFDDDDDRVHAVGATAGVA